MQTITEEQTVARLKLLDKPIDDYTDEELEQWLDNVIRPQRGKQPRKKSAAGAKTKTPKQPVNALDDNNDLA